MTKTISHLNAETFDEVIGSAQEPVLVDFWAEWCGPCKTISPILDEIAEEHGDSITIAKVNVDDAGEIAQRFKVLSIPTLILFEQGEAAKRLVGASSKAKLLSELSDYL